MKKVVLIDDELLARSLVREYLQNHPDYEIVDECENGFEGLKAIHNHKPDLIFLDIQMPKINGFEMLELVLDPPLVIFTTAFDEFAIRAFDSNAIDYLLKPFSQERFDSALNRLKNNQYKKDTPKKLENIFSNYPGEQQRIVVKTGTEIKILATNEIFLLEANDDHLNIYTADQVYLKRKTMSFYEEVLDSKQFFRPHRSFMFNIQYLTKIETVDKNSYLGLLTNGLRVPISRTSYSRLKELLGI